MTSSYTNIQVLARDAGVVRDAVDKRKLGSCKILGRPDSSWIGVYAFMTEGEYAYLRDYAQQLSEELNTSALGFMVESGELFKYVFYENGKLLDEYSSNSGYPMEKKAATGGDVTTLLKCCVKGTTKTMLKNILHPSKSSSAEPWSESERKVLGDKMAQNLAPLFGIPRSQMCTGYNYLKWAGVGKGSEQ